MNEAGAHATEPREQIRVGVPAIGDDAVTQLQSQAGVISCEAIGGAIQLAVRPLPAVKNEREPFGVTPRGTAKSVADGVAARAQFPSFYRLRHWNSGQL